MSAGGGGQAAWGRAWRRAPKCFAGPLPRLATLGHLPAKDADRAPAPLCAAPAPQSETCWRTWASGRSSAACAPCRPSALRRSSAPSQPAPQLLGARALPPQYVHQPASTGSQHEWLRAPPRPSLGCPYLPVPSSRPPSLHTLYLPALSPALLRLSHLSHCTPLSSPKREVRRVSTVTVAATSAPRGRRAWR